jgi:hypothetical protein
MDAANWAEQQLVAIPGWLLEDQNARLDQEGQFASIKEPRSPTIKKNKAKEELFTARRGGTRWRPKPSPPPHPTPLATFRPRPGSFQKKNMDLWKEVVDLRKRWHILEKKWRV